MEKTAREIRNDLHNRQRRRSQTRPVDSPADWRQDASDGRPGVGDSDDGGDPLLEQLERVHGRFR